MPVLNPDGGAEPVDEGARNGEPPDARADGNDGGTAAGAGERAVRSGDAAGSAPAGGVPPGAGGEIRMLDPRTIAVDRIAGGIAGACVELLYLLMLLGVLVASDWPWWAVWLLASGWVPLTGGLVWLAVKWPEIDFRHRRYRVTADGIEIWSGVLWRHAVIVPRSRVQHIDVSRGPLERSFGLATLSTHTAGTGYSKVDLSGLAHADALRIRDALLPKDAESAV